MELALYDPDVGYYARADQRSGRAGDFFTSVDVGPAFGELLAVQIAEMARLLSESRIPSPESRFDFVEAGAGNGRLSADILRVLRARHPELYDSLRLHLVEASARARAAQASVLGDVCDRLDSSSPALPDSFEGVLIANELLDALPVHQVVMRPDGLREVYVVSDTSSATRCQTPGSHAVPGTSLKLREASLSTVAISAYLDRLGVTLEPGWRVEVNLRAVEWIRDAARRLRRGFIILIDYGHEARELFSATHAQGTLTTFARHRSAGPETSSDAPAWLQAPGEQDITAHIDFSSVRAAAEAEGLQTLGFLDQTYFVLGLLPALSPEPSALHQAKTLLMPGGLGSTHKVMIFGKGVGTPSLQCCSFKMRVT